MLQEDPLDIGECRRDEGMLTGVWLLGSCVDLWLGHDHQKAQTQ